MAAIAKSFKNRKQKFVTKFVTNFVVKTGMGETAILFHVAPPHVKNYNSLGACLLLLFLKKDVYL